VWTGAENLAPTGIRSPDRPTRSESLYWLRYPGPHTHTHQCWPPLAPLKAAQFIQVINLWKSFTTAKFVHCHSWNCTVWSAETGGQELETQRSVATRKFRTFGGRMEDEWATGSSTNERGFRPIYGMTQTVHNPLRSANIRSLNLHRTHTSKCETVTKMRRPAKLWVMTVCNVHKSVTNCDRWPPYEGGEFHRFYCIQT
jgi:hypothetical protein